MMSSSSRENLLQPSTLQEAINVIKFLTTSHKQEITKLRDAYIKQAETIKKLEDNRKRELEFLSKELENYELNLAIRTEAVNKQLAQKDEIIKKQEDIIEEITNKLKIKEALSVPEITINIESNSDSGVALDVDDSLCKSKDGKPAPKTTRKGSRRFADSISFLRRVDFSPMKYKPSNREGTKKKDEKKKNLEVPRTESRVLVRQLSSEKATSDEDRQLSEDVDATLSDDTMNTSLLIRPKKLDESMNNHFSDDGSEDTSEELFDRVMIRSSVRRSVKANPKYKKINRTKSKLLEQVKINMVD
ncbi:uncharacterized protein LOC111001950 [Pieris rapae]|uniref:uncharacterized protein LOC111001950 n=1 Tax=Pieris rapae TaxID=64459 RepID=UPI001E27AFBA|nr:uncharacterized protein LOC111001950 [Pieris rapae]